MSEKNNGITGRDLRHLILAAFFFVIAAFIFLSGYKEDTNSTNYIDVIIREDENGNIIDFWKIDSSSYLYYEDGIIEFEIKSDIEIYLDSNNVTIIKDLKEEEVNYEEYHKYENFILSQKNSNDEIQELDDLNTIIIKSDLNGDITDVWKVNKKDYNYMDDGFVSFNRQNGNEIVIDSENVVVLKNLPQKESSIFEEYHKYEENLKNIRVNK